MMKKIKYAFLIVLLILVACSDSNEDQLIEGTQDSTNDELVLAIGGEPEEGFDPTTGWGRYGSPLFQSTLLKQDQGFNIVNDIATDYQVGEDGLEWIVTIREDVKFSDGEALTADDIIFTFETAKKSNSVVDLHNVKKVEKEDDYTIKFSLKKAQSTFVYALIATGIVPEHAYDEEYNEHPIGSGPYQLVQWDKGQQLIVENNPYYYGEPSIFKKLTFLFLDEDAAFAAAKSGDVDVVSVTPHFATEEIAGMKLEKVDSVDNRGVMFPFQPAGEQTSDGVPIGNDVTSDIAIRKAINIGIDRQMFVDGVLEGFGTPAYSVADQLPWWNADSIIEDNDQDKAIQILEEAGWKEDKKEGIREKNDLKASFTLIYPAEDQLRQSLSITFADMLKPLGIEVETAGKSWNEINDLTASHAVMMGWGSHDPLEMYHIYNSVVDGQGSNNSNYYSNPVVDDYMLEALHASTEEEANRYWQKAQWDGETGFSAKGDAPWAWLVNLEHVYFVRDNLEIGKQKIQPHGHGWPITDFIENWHWTE